MILIGNLYILVSYRNLLFKRPYENSNRSVNEIPTFEGTLPYIFMEKMNLGTRGTFRSFSHGLIHHLSKFDHDMSLN